MARNKRTAPALSVAAMAQSTAPELCCFDSDRTHFASVYSTVEKDECQIWHAENGQLLASVSSSASCTLTGKGQSIARYSALAWITQAEKGAKVLLAGTTLGSLLWISPSSGAVERSFDKLSTEKVADMVASPSDSSMVYIGYGNGWIVELNLVSGQAEKKWNTGKSAISRLSLSPDCDLLVSTYESSLTLWDTKTRKAIHSFHPHATDIQHVMFHPKDSAMMATAARNDRLVTLWRVGRSGETPLFSCSMDSSVHTFAFDTAGSLPTWVRLLLLSDSGALHVWELRASSSQTRNQPAKETDAWSGSCIGQIGLTNAATAEPLPIFAAQFSAVHPETSVHLVYGQLARQPAFEVLQYYDTRTNKPVSSITLSRTLRAGLFDTRSAAANADLPAAAISTSLPYHVQGPGNMAIPGMKGTLPSDLEPLASNGLSFEEELKRLQPALMNGDGREAPGSKRLSKKMAQSEGMALKANSAVTVLVQALHTQDKGLLESILSLKDADLIERTLHRLPVSYVLPFLMQVVGRFQAKPNRASGLLPWIRSLLVTHSVLLMSMPDLPIKLAGLYQTLEARMSSHRKLLELNGRLDLVLSQIATRSQLGTKAHAFAEEQESPLQVYREENENQENRPDGQEGESSDADAFSDDSEDDNMLSDDAAAQGSDDEIDSEGDTDQDSDRQDMEDEDGGLDMYD